MVVLMANSLRICHFLNPSYRPSIHAILIKTPKTPLTQPHTDNANPIQPWRESFSKLLNRFLPKSLAFSAENVYNVIINPQAKKSAGQGARSLRGVGQSPTVLRF